MTTALPPSQTRIVFMGTGTFAAPALAALIAADYDIAAVYTKPVATMGRGRRQTAENPVRDLAAAHAIPVEDPTGPLRDDATFARLASYAPDVIIVAAYGKILPERVLALPPHGCLNVHGSLLPRWRGASPIQAALIAGDTRTGVTIMRMDAGLDTGAIIATTDRVIAPDDTLPTLYTHLAADGAALLTTTLPAYLSGALTPHPQPADGITTCRTMTRDDGHVTWTSPTDTIISLARGCDPWPGIFGIWHTDDGQRRVKILDIARTTETPRWTTPGTIDVTPAGSILIATHDGAVQVDRLQIEGRRALTGTDIRNGYPALIGASLV